MRLVFLFVAMLFSTAPSWAAGRMALVLGNSAYQSGVALRLPVADATAMGNMFKELGFVVTSGSDLDEAGMRHLTAQFAEAAKGAELVAFYYSGNGLSVGGEDYLLPIDIKLETGDAALDHAVALRDILSGLDKTGAKFLVFHDGKRSSPFRKRKATSKTETWQPTDKTQFLIAYATSPRGVTLDTGSDHSPFAAALLKHLPVAGTEIEEALRKVKLDVYKATDGQQEPWTMSSLKEAVVLKAK